MIFQNVELHNVEALVPERGGYLLQRVPQVVCEKLGERFLGLSQNACGCEIRFKIKGDAATVILSANEYEEANVAFVYFGSIQGGWWQSTKVIHPHETRITIKKLDNLDRLKTITAERGLAFNPEVVRIVLPYGKVRFHGVEGDVEPPSVEDLPTKTYLAYGSSITHGSLALGTPYTYPFRVAQCLGCDSINFGFAGGAMMQAEMARYIISRKDWDFASVEMGINMIWADDDLFESSVKEFVDILATDPRPIFATSIYGVSDSSMNEKIARFREIVKRRTEGKLTYICGSEFLNEPKFISQDLVHPALDGMMSISQKWCDVLKNQV